MIKINSNRAVTRLCLSESSEVQTSGRSNQTQCCQPPATVATFLLNVLVLSGRNDAEMGPANSLHASAYYSEYNERFDETNCEKTKKLCRISDI